MSRRRGGGTFVVADRQRDRREADVERRDGAAQAECRSQVTPALPHVARAVEVAAGRRDLTGLAQHEHGAEPVAVLLGDVDGLEEQLLGTHRVIRDGCEATADVPLTCREPVVRARDRQRFLVQGLRAGGLAQALEPFRDGEQTEGVEVTVVALAQEIDHLLGASGVVDLEAGHAGQPRVPRQRAARSVASDHSGSARARSSHATPSRACPLIHHAHATPPAISHARSASPCSIDHSSASADVLLLAAHLGEPRVLVLAPEGGRPTTGQPRDELRLTVGVLRRPRRSPQGALVRTATSVCSMVKRGRPSTGPATTSDLSTSRATMVGDVVDRDVVVAHTASAAARLQPPANTDSRSNTRRSSSKSRS